MELIRVVKLVRSYSTLQPLTSLLQLQVIMLSVFGILRREVIMRLSSLMVMVMVSKDWLGMRSEILLLQ